MRTRCAAGCTGSTPLASTGSVTGPARDASGGSPRRSGRASSRWPARRRRGSWPGMRPGSCPLMMRAGRRSGPWSTLAQAARDAWHRRGAQPGPADPAGREGPLAADPQLGDQHRPGVRPKRTAVVELYTAPPPGSTVICADVARPGDPAHLPARTGNGAVGRAERRGPDGVSVADLEAACGRTRRWVYYRLREHAAAGRAVQVRRGYWRAARPPDGRPGPGPRDRRAARARPRGRPRWPDDSGE